MARADSEEGIFIPIHLDDSDLEREGEQAKQKVGRIADDIERRSRRSAAGKTAVLGGGGLGSIEGLLKGGGAGGIGGILGTVAGISTPMALMVNKLADMTGATEALTKQFSKAKEIVAAFVGIETERVALERRRIQQIESQIAIAGTEDPRAQAELQFQDVGRVITEKLEAEDISEAEAFKLRIAAQQRRNLALRGIQRQEFAAGAAALGLQPGDIDTTEEFKAVQRAIEQAREDKKKLLRQIEEFTRVNTIEGF